MSRIGFDQALPTLVRLCEAHPAFAEIQRAAVVRDLRGRVRLVVKPNPRTAPDLARLAQELRQVLGGYFNDPILSVAAENRDEARLAGKLLEQSTEWDATYRDPVSELPSSPPPGRWRKLERRLAKHAWLAEGRPSPPWELGSGPGIVTFYSFKGGVGRSTALISCAWQLARDGKRVTVIDLDLEGPGLGTLLEAGQQYGVIDFIVDHLAADRRDLDQLSSPAHAFGDLAEKVDLLAAGVLEAGYLEKLARLDFQSSVAGDESSPIETALAALFHATRQHLLPDYILVDARSGLHDLAGLSLHGLAHVDVLFTRASQQSYAGLDLTLRALAQRRVPEDLLAIVVHAFAPPDRSSELYRLETQEVLERSYDGFCEHIYGDDAPALEASDAPHHPRPLLSNSALERFENLRGVESHLLSEDYRALLERVVELCRPPKEKNP